jgi:hypothetical protein
MLNAGNFSLQFPDSAFSVVPPKTVATNAGSLRM